MRVRALTAAIIMINLRRNSCDLLKKKFLIMHTSVSSLLCHVDPGKHARCKTIIKGIT